MPKTLCIRQIEGKAGEVYYPLELSEVTTEQPKKSEVVVRLSAAALNHRDLFIRQKLYGGIGFGVPLCADGCGWVVSTGSSPAARKWHGKRVIINPGTGWKDDPAGPESPKGYQILGGTKYLPKGTAVEELVIDAGELEEAPEHLNDHEAAALPLTGLTAWRATTVKAKEAMQPGHNILVTGIGGGVAIMALIFAINTGANVYVSSGSPEKLAQAKQLGATGGVNYKEADWEQKLVEMLPTNRKKLDAIIDGAGGNIVEKGVKMLKAGGVISQYGMTVSPKLQWVMPAVLKNIELRGSTMGSRKDFADMVQFVKDKKARPVVSKVAGGGLDNLKDIDGLFEDMKNGSQFGKLVIEINTNAEAKL